MKKFIAYLIFSISLLAFPLFAQEINPIHGYPSNPTFANVVVGTTLRTVKNEAELIANKDFAGTVLVNSDITLSANLTTTCNLSINRGCAITTTGFTLTVNGPLDAGDYQIFSGTGTVNLSSCPSRAKSIWFGSGAAGIHAALDATPKELIVAPGTYQDVTIDADDFALILSEGVLFQTSAGGLVPAIQFNGCDRVEVRGRLVADGNKANNTHAYTNANIGYEYATVGFNDCTAINLAGGIYVYNAWHDAVCIEGTQTSHFGQINISSPTNRGLILWESCEHLTVGDVMVISTSSQHGVRTGGNSGKEVKYSQIGNVMVKGCGVIVEAYSEHINIGNILAEDNGVKIEEGSYITVGNINVTGAIYSGVLVNSSTRNTHDITIGDIVATGCVVNTDDGIHAGVYINAAGAAKTYNVAVGRIVSTANGNATVGGGYGLRIRCSDPSGTVENVAISGIITTDNLSWGTTVEDTGTVQNVSLGQIVSNGNTTGDFRVASGVKNVSWSGAVAAVPNNSMGASTLFGNRIVLEAVAADQSTGGTGADIIATKTVGSGVMGATGGLHFMASGTKTNTNSEAKTISLDIGGTSITCISGVTTATDWTIEGWIFNVSATSQRVTWIAHDGATVTQGYDTTAINTTANFTVRIYGEVGATGADTITRRMWFVERL